jgi:Ca2+-transporting ATPase
MRQVIQATEEDLSEEPAEKLLDSLGTDQAAGLSSSEAANRLEKEGVNELEREKSIDFLSLLIDQFKSSVVILLLVAAIISFAMKEYLQTAGIVAALIINAAIGFLTEYRAQLSLASLARLAGATVRVRREGGELELPVRELVRGDIVLLEAGNRVPADARILESAALSVDESQLTGESVSVWKSAAGQTAESRVVFQGSSVQSGRAIGAVIATGAHTRMGKLGRMLEEVAAGETPLTKSLNTLGHQLTFLVVGLSAFFGCLGIWRHSSLERMVETSIALAVAAIPEGLPVIATLALAAGIRRMVLAKALVRRLPAVETLGCTTVICTDKTGTLTENKMLVTDIVLDHGHMELSGRGYEPAGELTNKDTTIEINDRWMHDLLLAICLCNDARLENHEDGEGWHIHGDPTEGSLITAALKLGVSDAKSRLDFPRVAEIPFDLSRKRMTTVHAIEGDGCVLFLKGAPESVLPICHRVRSKDGDIEFSSDRKEWFTGKNHELAGRGLRVLAVATRKVEKLPDNLEVEYLERELILLGLVAMSDRPKESVEAAIRTCQDAGVRVVMLTGDQPETAKAVASELGIISPATEKRAIISGDELKRIKDGELMDVIKDVAVLARVTPEMKLNIVQRLQVAGHVVAMTGDGVNDAPALRQSNIGIAMGLAGTDLAREASDLVITDDNFATIVEAIHQGRITYANISRAVAYLLTASLTSVIAVTLGLLANTGLFLEPLQLLYLNLIMHVFPGLGIVLQKGSADEMKYPPRKRSEKLLDKYEQVQIIARSILIGGISLLAVIFDQRYLGGDSATTVALAMLSLSLVLQSWSWLSAGRSPVKTSWNINRPMLLTTGINLLLLALAIYLPWFQCVLDTKALNIEHLCLVLATALATYLISMPLSFLAMARKVKPIDVGK